MILAQLDCVWATVTDVIVGAVVSVPPWPFGVSESAEVYEDWSLFEVKVFTL